MFRRFALFWRRFFSRRFCFRSAPQAVIPAKAGIQNAGGGRLVWFNISAKNKTLSFRRKPESSVFNFCR